MWTPPALGPISTRPGRIDKAVELSYMEPADKKRMAERILGSYPADHAAMLAFIVSFDEVTITLELQFVRAA